MKMLLSHIWNTSKQFWEKSTLFLCENKKNANGFLSKRVVITLCGVSIILFAVLTFYNKQPQPVGAIPTLPTQAHTVAGERVTVEQRGNSVRAQFPWKGEQGIAVSYDMGAATPAERAKGKRNRQVITEQLNDTDFKIDIILDEKPNTNVFCYNIENHQDYDFFYQPALTPEEIAEGASRPDIIVGSYAVYHKTLKNHVLGEQNYATGKVMHIPRPEVWEVNNKEATRQWADLSYNNGQLCVTANQSFLDNATYPVRIDPTFGYTSIGATEGTIADSASDRSWSIGSARNLSSAATLDSIHIALDSDDADTETVDFFAALYREDSAGSGSHDLVVGIERTSLSIDGTPQFYTFTASSESLSADDYIISAIGDGEDVVDGAIKHFYDSVESHNFYAESTIGVGSYTTRKAEDPWTEVASVTTNVRSFYATYTATPAATVTNNLNISGDIEIEGDITIN